MKPDALRKLFRAWPGVAEDVKWGADLVFSVCDKMFCVYDMSTGRIGFKVEKERFLEMTDRPGVVPAPYLARAHWISVSEPSALSVAELRTLIRASYELVRAKLPKRLRSELEDRER